MPQKEHQVFIRLCLWALWIYVFRPWNTPLCGVSMALEANPLCIVSKHHLLIPEQLLFGSSFIICRRGWLSHGQAAILKAFFKFSFFEIFLIE